MTTTTVINNSKKPTKAKSCQLGNRKSMTEGGVITLPVLLSMGVGTLRESEAIQYINARRLVRSKTAPHSARRISYLAPDDAHGNDSDDSYYSDSSFYDSENSFDMKLLAHRKRAPQIHNKPLHERVQYLFDDIKYFTHSKPKPKNVCDLVTNGN